MKKNPKFEQYLLEEALLFQKLVDIDGLIKFYGVTHENITEAGGGPSMILEYCQYGSL